MPALNTESFGTDEVDLEAWRAIGSDGPPVQIEGVEARGGRFIDPYALWALKTRYRAFCRYVDDGAGTKKLALKLPFIGELVKPDQMPQCGVVVPDVYKKKNNQLKHLTCVLPIDGLDLNQIDVALRKVLTCGAFVRLQIGFPQPPVQAFLPADSAAIEVAPPLAIQLEDQVSVGPALLVASDAASPAESTPQPEEATVVLGILDDACPFAHAAFRQGTVTRIHALWNQTSRIRGYETPWKDLNVGQSLPADFRYGAILDQAGQQDLLNRHVKVIDGVTIVNEEAVYRDPSVRFENLRFRTNHAAAVMGLFASEETLSPVQQGGSESLKKGEGGVSTNIVAVQFPLEEMSVAGSRWLAVNALDGLHFVIQSAHQIANDPSRLPPIVVNLSYGGTAGAHDGTGLLESAMDELCQHHGQLAIVLAAGNSHGAGYGQIKSSRNRVSLEVEFPCGGIHARQAIEKSIEKSIGKTKTFTLFVPPEKTQETFLEIWFSRSTGDDRRTTDWLKNDEASVRVSGPLGAQVLEAKCGGLAQFGTTKDGDVVSGLIFVPKASQSRGKSMALFALAGTRGNNLEPDVAPGLWTIEVTNCGESELLVDCWVERDESPSVGVPRQQSRLVANVDGSSDGLSDEETFSSVATGHETFRVGALREYPPSSVVDPYSLSPYTSDAGSRAGPEASCVVDAGIAMPGIPVIGALSGQVSRLNGTSMAAPQAARWIAEQLASGQTLSQVRKTLTQGIGGCKTSRRGSLVKP